MKGRRSQWFILKRRRQRAEKGEKKVGIHLKKEKKEGVQLEGEGEVRSQLEKEEE